MLAPILKDVPYVNKILPDDAVEQVSTEDSAYAYDTMADAVERIKELEKELADAQNASSANADYISQLEAQSQELQQYKENEAEFEKEKQSFYEDVVFSDVAPDIEEYKKYYESIDPANAEVLYKQVVAQTAEDEQLDDYIKTYSSFYFMLYIGIKKTDHITALYALSFYSYKSSCSFTSLLSAMHCFKAMIIFSASSGFAR